MTRPIQIRLIRSMTAAALLVLLTAGVALAKCGDDPGPCEGMIVTLDPGGSLGAGGSETVGVFVLRDEQPYDATSVDLTFTRLADGTATHVAAEPTGSDGRWQAAVELPAGGTWTVSAQVVGAEFVEEFALDPIAVAPPAATPSPAAPGATPLTSPLLGAGVLAAVAVVLSGLVLRTRRAPAAIG